MSNGLTKYLKIDTFITLNLALIAFLFPISPKIVVYFITTLVVLSITSWVKKGVYKFRLENWPFILLFVFYLVGLLFTSNFDYGLKDIETRSTFVIFPIFLGLTKIDKKSVFPVTLGLVFGCFLAIGYCIYNTFECYEIYHYEECFEGSRLAAHMHPTYLGLYLIVAATFAGISMRGRGIGYKIFASFSILVFVGMVYRLYSLGPWIGMVAMLVVLTYAYFHFKNKRIYFLGGMVVMGICGFLAIKNLSFLKSDFEVVNKELKSFFEDKEKYIAENQLSIGSVSGRIMVWNASLAFIKKHPFGVGTGDVKDELMDWYLENGMTASVEKKLNPHCQYLQTAGSIGIAVSIFLILTLAYYLWLGFKRKNYYLIALISLFSVACLFESVLERQWGIVFFMFFLSLLLNISAQPETNSSDNIEE